MRFNLQLQLLLGHSNLQQQVLHLHCQMEQAQELTGLLRAQTCRHGLWQCFVLQIPPNRSQSDSASGAASVVKSTQYAARWDFAQVGSVLLQSHPSKLSIFKDPCWWISVRLMLFHARCTKKHAQNTSFKHAGLKGVPESSTWGQWALPVCFSWPHSQRPSSLSLLMRAAIRRRTF